MTLQRFHQRAKRAGKDAAVGIQDPQQRRLRQFCRLVDRRAEAAIGLVGDQLDRRVAAQDCGAAVGRRVVDHDDIGGHRSEIEQGRGDARDRVRRGVVVDDDDADRRGHR
jgi:hypothetical protein